MEGDTKGRTLRDLINYLEQMSRLNPGYLDKEVFIVDRDNANRRYRFEGYEFGASVAFLFSGREHSAVQQDRLGEIIEDLKKVRF